KLCEPDPVHYDEQFSRLVATLATVSPVVEPAELGRAYIGTDGLEGLFGAPEKIVEVIQLRIADCGLRIGNGSAESAIANPQSEIRVGWGRGKFVSWVAASRARPRRARADRGGAHVLFPGRGAGTAGANIGHAPRPCAQESASDRLARARGVCPSRARARRVLARDGDVEGSDRGPGAVGRAPPIAARAVAACWSGRAAGGRVHRVRAGHSRAAAVRTRCECRGSRRAAARAQERRPGDRAPDQTADVVSRHRGATMVSSPRAAVRADRLWTIVRNVACGVRDERRPTERAQRAAAGTG